MSVGEASLDILLPLTEMDRTGNGEQTVPVDGGVEQLCSFPHIRPDHFPRVTLSPDPGRHSRPWLLEPDGKLRHTQITRVCQNLQLTVELEPIHYTLNAARI